MHLINLLEHFLTSGRLILHAPLWSPSKPFQPVFPKPTPLHVLHQILGAIMKLNESHNIWIPLESIQNIVINLGVLFMSIGFASESLAWEGLKIRILHTLDGSLTSPSMANALGLLSIAHQRQLQFHSALKASQQSLDLWYHISESLPEVDNQIGQLTALTTHARNLLETGQKRTALSKAQDAVALSQPIFEQIIKSSSGPSSLVDEFKAVCMSLYGCFQLRQGSVLT
ncbi:hypothetical protein K438DRAFT_648769 [Mycena galopus ATCC 62051]|nr:hypothetical protein K438DRAFT_648769 [Mycena galopus ATCC 62051]